MKRETKILLNKSKESLILAIEFFNRPHDIGRATASLIFLDHAFEMLMKASILHKNGTIRDDKNSQKTIGFKECLQRGISNQAIKFISEEQGISLQAINGERDAAQHHILQISEQQLYIFLQSGVTMFDDILFKVFNEHLQSSLPRRVLPVATTAPLDIERLFRFEINEIRKMLEPRKRKKMEALARIRPLAILDSAIQGVRNIQFSEKELDKYAKKIKDGIKWTEIFPGVSVINLTVDGQGPALSLRITKKADAAFRLAQEGDDDLPVAVKRVNDFDFYNLTFKLLLNNLKKHFPTLNQAKLQVFIKHYKIKTTSECYKEFKRNTTQIKAYSSKALDLLKEELSKIDIEKCYKEWRDNKSLKTNATIKTA